jgi:hypothetical protein
MVASIGNCQYFPFSIAILLFREGNRAKWSENEVHQGRTGPCEIDSKKQTGFTLFSSESDIQSIVGIRCASKNDQGETESNGIGPVNQTAARRPRPGPGKAKALGAKGFSLKFVVFMTNVMKWR